MTDIALPPAPHHVRDRALSILLSDELDDIVDLVAWRSSPTCVDVASSTGHIRVTRHPDPSGPTYDHEVMSGTSPVHNQNPAHLGTLAEEVANPHPARHDNSYPHAFDHISQVFDHESAPDLMVLHTGSHFWGEHGGHLGEHGSLGILQARAPFIIAGAGVSAQGLVADSCRLVDVAPTMLELLGAPSGQLLAHHDGTSLRRVIDTPAAARHVVAFLLDGTNPNVLYDMVARGELPNISELVRTGTAFQHGAIASLPTVTLANHTGILTGSHPGHHGVLHNAWVDRASGEQVITNSPSTWTTSMKWLHPGIETMHHAVHRHFPGALSVSLNEPCDAGADFSVFELMRRGENVDRPPRTEELPDATERFVRPSKEYRWSSLIDHTAVDQFRGIWSGSYRGATWEIPKFTWMNFTLTDAAFHEGGPYSEIAAASLRDTDARIGHVLNAVTTAGVRDHTAFVLVADHGMQLADENVTGDWDAALRNAGVSVRDEGYGFLYLTNH